VKRSLIVLALAVLVTGCALSRVSSVDPAQIPDGPLEPIGGSDEPTGPLTEIGRGRSLGYGWRYVVYETAAGMCNQFEMASVTSSSCGEAPDGESGRFAGVGHSDGSPVTVDGTVGEDAVEVWIELSDGPRIAATLMSLEPAGLPGYAFVGFAPEGSGVSRVVAIGADGSELSEMGLGH
jgi:hypothetical protein